MTMSEESICNNLEKKLSEKCAELKEKLESKKFVSYLTFSNHFESNLFSDQSCTKLILKCFYYELGCSSISNLCIELRSTCYKKGLNAYINFMLEGFLQQILYKPDSKSVKLCSKTLIDLCDSFHVNDRKFLSLCLYPQKTCLALNEYIIKKAMHLSDILKRKLNFVEHEDCYNLETKCENLKSAATFLSRLCDILHKKCNFLKNVQQLEDHLLYGKKDTLSNTTNCMEVLKKKCSRLHIKDPIYNNFCNKQEKLCEAATTNVQSHCEILRTNIKNQNVLNDANNVSKRESICLLWEPYCDKYMPNCYNILVKENGNTGICLKLKMNCEPFQKLNFLENMVIYKLQGSLNDQRKCKSKLGEYCREWEKQGNITLINLCKDSNKKNINAIEQLCKKFLDKIKNNCETKHKDLSKEADDLEDDYEDYKNIKKKIEEINSEFVLSVAAATIDTKNITANISVSNKIRIKFLRQSKRDYILTTESTVVDMIKHAQKLYKELNKTCQALLLECGFKEECPLYLNVCNEIEHICNKLQRDQPPKLSFDETTKTIETTTKTSIDKETDRTIKTIETTTETSIDKETDKTEDIDRGLGESIKICIPKMVLVVMIMIIMKIL